MGNNDFLQQWQNQSHDPAAPEGLQQQAAGRARETRDGQDYGFLQQWQNTPTGGPTGYTEQAQSWYTGANAEGQNNGWSNQFTQEFVAGQNKAAQDGTLNTYFEKPNATGVVTWDHESTDGTTVYRFGDVYDHGKKQANLYDQFDKPTADLMMADWIFPSKQKAEIFSDSDPTSRLRREVESMRQQNNTEIPKALQAADFQKDVSARTKEFEQGNVDELITGGGVAGGLLLTGGAVAATGVGAPVGLAIMGVGGLVGGVGAYLNKDSLTEQAARAYEITAMSSRENGDAAGFATGVQQWAGFGGQLISPLQNLNRGYVDWSEGDVGDGKAAYYKVNKKGEAQRPGWSKYTDFGAMVGDSLLQFASPTGVTAYTAQMTGTITGEVGELVLTGGKSFDYSRGGFDNVFTDDSGNFSPTQAAAGIGKVGIDVVQLGFARGLAGKADASLERAGEGAVYASMRIGRNRLPTFLGGRTAEEQAAIAAGGRETEAAGLRFTLDAEGKVVSKRATLSILAPSEMLHSLSARVIAVRDVAKTKGAYSVDDFYRAANSLATGERKINTVLVNAMGEGSEEAIQEVFDEHSHGQRLDFTSIEQAAVGGFAAGAGMGLGTTYHSASADDQMFAIAKLNDPALEREAWKALPETEKRTRAAQSEVQRKLTESAFAKYVDDQGFKATATVAQVNRLADAIQANLDSAAGRASDRTDGAFTITQTQDAGRMDEDGNLTPDSIPNDGVATSLVQLSRNLNNHLRGMLIAKDKFTEDLKAIDPADAEQVSQVTRKIQLAEQIQVWGQQVDTYIQAVEGRVANATTYAEVQAESEALNHMLRLAFNRQVPEWDGRELTEDDKYSLARAVSHVFTRDPQDQAGSYQVLVPQMSPMLTWTGSDNLAQINHALLGAISGDYDGDKIRQLAQLVLDDNEYESARSGAYYLGAGSSVNIPAPKYEKYLIHYMAQALKGADETMQAYAGGVMLDITEAIRRRYDGVVDDKVLDQVFGEFFNAVHRGSDKARGKLLDGLAQKAGGPIDEFARKNLSNEWLWIDQLVRATMQEFQVAFVEYRNRETVPNTEAAAPHLRTPDGAEKRASDAASLGAQMGLLLPGDSLFRMFQKLHFSSLASKSLTAEQAGDRMDVAEMAALYEALGQGITQSEIDAVRGKDNITNYVFVQLRRVAESSRKEMSKQLGRKVDFTEALAVVANLRVSELDVDENGHYLPNRSGKKTLTLAQMLLKQATIADKRRNARVLDIDTDLQAKYAKLERMVRPNSRSNPNGAEQTFLEVMGDQTFYSILGPDSGVFGPHLTLNQYLRGYIGMDEAQRQEEWHKLNKELAYLGRKNTKDMPYDLDEVAQGKITSFRSVVDSIMAVGNGTISMDEDGTLHGEIFERSERTGQAMRDAHKNMLKLVDQMVEIGGRKKGETRIELVQRVLRTNPELDTAVAGLIPRDFARYAVTRKGDQIVTANWVYALFDETMTHEEAEMHLLRNIIMAGWRAAAVDPKAEGAEEGQKSREFHRLDSRWHRVMWMAAAQNDGGTLYKNLMVQMQKSKSVKEFEHWVNTTPGVRGHQAPLVAWVDDTGEFDKDKTNGGWAAPLKGAELREAIRVLQTTTENLVEDMGREREAWEDDQRVLDAIEAGDADLTARMQASIEQAANLADGVGPNAMVMQTAFAAWGFYGKAHNKGTNPLHVMPQGLYDAHRDAYGFLSNYERMMASLTSTNLSAISQHLSQLPKDAGRTMTEDGRPVEFQRYTVEEMTALFRDPETRAYARAILYPQVLESTPSGQLSPQMVVGRSLRELLDGTSFNKLYDQWDRLSLDSAMRYGTMVEAMARKTGGHFALQRLANDMTIAQLSGATEVLSFEDVVDMTHRNYYEIAQILQATASIQSQERNARAGTLQALKKKYAAAARHARLKDVVGDSLTEEAIKTFLTEREKEVTTEHDEILKRIKPNTPDAEVLRIQEQALAVLEAHQRYKARFDLLRSDDLVAQVAEMFTVPDDPTQAVQHIAAIQTYINVTGIDVFRNKATASTSTLRELANKMNDAQFDGVDKLTLEQWQELGRAAIAIHLDELGSVTPATISVPPFPDLGSEAGKRQARYWDASFSYLLDDLFDAESPLLQAAVELHRRAGRQEVETVENELDSLLGRTLFADHRFGQWTSDVSRGSMYANAGLDSAAAAPAVAIAGDSPKRQATESAATERTYATNVDGVTLDTLTSKVTLGWLELENHDRNPFDQVTLTGAVNGQRPLAQLNNRFAKSVVLTLVDGAGQQQQIDLMAVDKNVGWPFHAKPETLGSGFQAIHLERIKQAIQNQAEILGFNPAGVTVEVEFLHPDSQPSGPQWMNNLYFEGTSFKLDADRHDSLNSTLWFAFGSISPQLQAQALQASKKGKAALQVVKMPDDSTRVAIEAKAMLDFAGMLRDKAEIMVTRDLGFGRLDVEAFNSVYKNLKMRHFVRGQDADGNAVLWSAEQVIEHQLTNPGVDLPFENARLWVPTDQMLRDLLGEVGQQGVAARTSNPELEITRVAPYRGVTAEMTKQVEAGLLNDGALTDTNIIHRARQSQMQVRAQLNTAARTAFETQMQYHAAIRQEVGIARSQLSYRETGGFDWQKNLDSAVAAGNAMLQAENIALDIRTLIPFIGPRNAAQLAAGQMLLANVAAIKQGTGYSTGWIYEEGVASELPKGVLSNVSLNDSVPMAYRVAPGDLVVIRVNTFNGDMKKAKQRIDYFAGRGAYIVLASEKGDTNNQAELGAYLATRSYERVPGSKHLYEPENLDARYQNVRARLQHMTEARVVTPRNHLMNLLVQGLDIEENAAYANADNPNLKGVGLQMDLVPTDWLYGFNVPVNDSSDRSQADRVMKQLQTFDNPEGRSFLRDMARPNNLKDKKAIAEHDAEWDEAWNRMIRRFDEFNQVLPKEGTEFGTGDFIPLVGPNNRILLYRHGYKAPEGRAEVNAQANTVMPGSQDAANISIYPSERNPAATTHHGKVVSIDPRSGYGLSMELNVDLQTLGGKMILEWNGMKYVLTDKPERMIMPDHSVFAGGWGIDLISSLDDAISKESFGGVVNNHRNAFAYFGIDFLPDVAKFLGVEPAKAKDLLDSVAKRADRISIATADELIAAAQIGPNIQQLLAPIATESGDTAWVEKLATETSVEAQITTAMLIYLLTPGAQVKYVLQSGGFNDLSSNIDSFSRLMPPIFTQAFDRAPIGSDLRREINRRINTQLYNPKHDGTGYSLSETWEFTVHNSGRVETDVSEVDAFDILSHYVPTDSNLTNEQIAAGKGDPEMWDRKLAEAKASGLYESIKNAGKITEPIVLADLTLPTPWPLPFVMDGHHRLVVAADLGIPVPWRYESDPEGARQTGAPRGVSKFKVVTTGTPGKDIVGMLQFSEAHFASENPVLNGQAFDENQRQSYSSHSAAIAHQATGGDVVYKYDIATVRNYAKGVRELSTDDIANGTLWRELTNIDRESAEALADWRAETPAESARRKLARASMIMFRKELVKTKEHGWTDEQRNTYRARSNDILRELGLDEKQGMLVDYWVRQQIGEALGVDNEGVERGNVSGDWAIEIAGTILDLVQTGNLPTVGAMVPLTHINDLQAIFRANYGKDNGWHPAEGIDPGSDRAASWDDWVNISLGSGVGLLNNDLFDQLYLLATDGFFHGYQNATRSLLDLPVSLDREIQRQLLDPQTNMRLVSINPNVQTSATQTLLVDFHRAGLADLLSGIRMTGNAPAGAVAKKKAQIRRWRKENNVPIPVDASMRNFRRNGERFVDSSTRANALSRSLINLRVGTAMINPALYFSMGPEQWIRGSLDRLANTLTLQSTAVRLNKQGEAVGMAARTAQALEALDETKLGEIMQRFGISYRYDRDQLAKLAILSESLGDSLDFKAMVYRDLMFLRPHAPDVGRIEKWLANYARFGARMQDPTWGMRAKTLGRRYVEAVLMHLEATPTMHNLTPDMLVAEMQSDPTFLQKNFPDAHRAGTNAIAQLRSLKMTTASKMLRGIYEPMAESDHAGVNFFGNVVLKMPLIFSGYAMNVATTITGMQGADQMYAAFMHGRSKGFIGRMQARLRGDAFNPETDAVFDFSDVLEGADLTRSFIRGGLTHAGLFYFGMMAGGLGLSGEDDETKKRRRMAKLQGAGMIYDPRALENDFRNSDALFLDALPFNLGSYFTVNGEGQEMAQMHWMLKQFVSPVLGMERFYETGDFRNVTWGFEDALGSFPLINSLGWSDAVSTAHEFAKMASDNDKKTLGGPDGMPRTAALLANAVGTYERMLFENSFVNQLYVGLDAYDRDPYILPLRNSNGEIQKTIDNQAREQNIAFQPYVDPETGEIKTGYVGRSDTSGTIHALTENRASMAFVSALFTGLGHSDYLRYNMVPKTREMAKPVMTQAEAEAVIHYITQGEAQPALTEEEMVSVIKGQAMAGKSPNWDLYNKADELAKKGYDPNKLEPLSYFTADDREVLSHAGAAAVFRGILKGTAKPGSPSFAGIYIPMEMRKTIQAEWTKEIIQEGVDMGLDVTKATSRMKRLWGGPYGDESVKGIGDILFDPSISYAPSTTYRQLNTTYVMGPDGKPWATGFTRDGLMGALGLKPLKRAYLSESPETTSTDDRLNTTDLINNTNTGLRALELVDSTMNVPTDVEIGKAIEKAITDAAKQSYTPYTPYTKTGSSRYNGYGRKSYGGGGGYSSGGYPQFNRMYNLPGGTTAYANDIPFASVSNPILRRADIRRERVWSERGRLKQWQ